MARGILGLTCEAADGARLPALLRSILEAEAQRRTFLEQPHGSPQRTFRRRTLLGVQAVERPSVPHPATESGGAAVGPRVTAAIGRRRARPVLVQRTAAARTGQGVLQFVVRQIGLVPAPPWRRTELRCGSAIRTRTGGGRRVVDALVVRIWVWLRTELA